MSSWLQTTSRRLRTSWMLSAGLIALLLVAGVWLILDRFADQDSGYVEPVAVVEQGEGIDQPLTAHPEAGNGQDDWEPSRNDTDAESDLLVARTPPPDLGLDEIVREYILWLWGGALDAQDDYGPSTDAKLESVDPETRRRGEFETVLHIQFWSRQGYDPYYPLLSESTLDAWWSCFGEYGVPPLEEFGPLTQEQQDAVMEELGLVGERMEQVQGECWSRARIYAGKDEETDRLLMLQHQYYLDVAQDWVEENPDSVVPLVEDADVGGGVGPSGSQSDLGAGYGVLDERPPRSGVFDDGGEGVSGSGGAGEPEFRRPGELVGYPGQPGAVVGRGEGPLRNEHSPWEAVMGEVFGRGL